MLPLLIRIEEYIRPDKSNPYKAWFDRLDSQAAIKVATALLRLRQGNTSSIKWLGGIGECKIDWGPGYRIYLCMDGEKLIILFGGGTKKSQQKDIAKARQLHQEYKQAKQQTNRFRSKPSGN